MKTYIPHTIVLTGTLLWCNFVQGQDAPLLPQLSTSPHTVVSTVPPNGDGNPYGVASVPNGFPSGGPLSAGDILVSNFNASSGLQGTGTTIVQISKGKNTLFYQAPLPTGLTTALGVLASGFVIVGNLPTSNGSSGSVRPGSLIIVDRWGNTLMTLANTTLLDGPWDLTVAEQGSLARVFVSNVLSGTVTRLDINTNAQANHVSLISATQIASGYTHRFDPNALVVGPTGLAYDSANNTLYVASTGDNAIYSVPNALGRASDAGKGALVYTDRVHLHGPLGLVLAPNGNLITSNGDAVNPGGTDNELVEFTLAGSFVAQYQVDPGAPGAAFGLAFGWLHGQLEFATVDDNNNTLGIWKIQ